MLEDWSPPMISTTLDVATGSRALMLLMACREASSLGCVVEMGWVWVCKSSLNGLRIQ